MGDFLFLHHKKCHQRVDKTQNAGHKTANQTYRNGNQNNREHNVKPGGTLLAKTVFCTEFQILGNVKMIPCKIKCVGCVFSLLLEKGLLLAAKDHLAQERTVRKLATNNRAAKEPGIKQRHCALGVKSLFFAQRPYKRANNTAAKEGCDRGDDDAPN